MKRLNRPKRSSSLFPGLESAVTFGRQKVQIALFVVFAVLSCTATPVWAEICKSPDLKTLERPTSAGEPTDITASFIVADVLAVNDVDQKIELDVIATFTWRDMRLNGLDGCQFQTNSVWFPRLSLLDSSVLDMERKGFQNQVQIGPNGSVFYRQRYSGTISTYHDLRQFPFDRHVFDIGIVTLENDTQEIRFVANNDATSIADTLNIEGWAIGAVSLFTEVRNVRQVGLDLSVLTLRIEAEREASYFIFRVLLPMVLVVAMSWAVFWVPPDRFEFQIGLGATSMLTVVAFNLAIGNTLPALGYLTALDAMIVWAILLVFLSIAEALLAGLLHLNGKGAQAQTVDRISRVLFPLSLFSGFAAIVLLW